MIVYNRKVRKAGAAIQTEAANLNKVMHESFTGNRIIKGYNLERVVMDRFRAKSKKNSSAIICGSFAPRKRPVR